MQRFVGAIDAKEDRSSVQAGTPTAADGLSQKEPRFVSFVERTIAMIRAALCLLALAIVAAVFGFGGVAESAAGPGKVLFVVGLVLAGFSLFLGPRVIT